MNETKIFKEKSNRLLKINVDFSLNLESKLLVPLKSNKAVSTIKTLDSSNYKKATTKLSNNKGEKGKNLPSPNFILIHKKDVKKQFELPQLSSEPLKKNNQIEVRFQKHNTHQNYYNTLQSFKKVKLNNRDILSQLVSIQNNYKMRSKILLNSNKVLEAEKISNFTGLKFWTQYK